MASATPEVMAEIKEAVAQAEKALHRVNHLVEKHGIPVQVPYAGWFIGSTPSEILIESYDYSLYSEEILFDSLLEEGEDKSEVEALLAKVHAIIGDDHIAYADCWDSSHC